MIEALCFCRHPHSSHVANEEGVLVPCTEPDCFCKDFRPLLAASSPLIKGAGLPITKPDDLYLTAAPGWGEIT